FHRLLAVAGRADELQPRALVRALDLATHDVRVVDDHQLERCNSVQSATPVVLEGLAQAARDALAEAGSQMRKRPNPPTVVDTPTLPPSSWIRLRTMSMPTPRPASRVTWSWVEKPAMKMSESARRSSSAAACSAVIRPRLTAACLSFSASSPRPSSWHT